MSRFSERSAIVTGAAAGIGRATAQLLAAEGAAVAVFDIAEAGAQETAQAIEAAGGRAFVRVCDISDPGSVRESVAAAREALGPLSVLCNVAGLQQWTRIEDTSYELWSRILGINLTGTYLMSQAALPHLVETRGAIVNVASSAGLRGIAYSVPYCASKGGIVMLTQSMSKELSDRGVRVNAVAPGGTLTGMMGLPMPEQASPEVMKSFPRSHLPPAEPEQIASVIAFLASEEASNVNGTVLPVDGGMIA